MQKHFNHFISMLSIKTLWWNIIQMLWICFYILGVTFYKAYIFYVTFHVDKFKNNFLQSCWNVLFRLDQNVVWMFNPMRGIQQQRLFTHIIATKISQAIVLFESKPATCPCLAWNDGLMAWQKRCSWTISCYKTFDRLTKKTTNYNAKLRVGF